MSLSPEERLGLDIVSTEHVLMTAKTAALRPLGLTVAQYAALLTLSQNPGISGAGLARACLVTPQAAAAVLKTLEAKALVERFTDDWNLNVRPARLTPKGLDLLRRADEAAVRIERAIRDALSPGERTELRELLHRCRAAIDGATAEAAASASSSAPAEAPEH
ncbi:MarR family winged helix-turn-helix transcriptional regulator [Saccharomonospora xinjiangensis]|uniref:Transcriptional regulator n=1 Tax=Saccharomonospora xinjiangensis XJ-54 TaxID=882086 RepID=I0V8I4_9PSEU|nr:MarR family transcriptional regulator [Saccharomonospora xinjiangensis]EID56437.1 transcriptional regulator [Saccharomonospora xinjiangensis XJ-54]